MDDKNLQKIITEIARKHRTTPEHVREEMQTAMDLAMSNPDHPHRPGGHVYLRKVISTPWKN